MGVLADLIALVNGNTEKTLDVLIQEKATETNNKVDSVDAKIQVGNNTIGVTNNTGGSTISGTVFAKLNKLLADWTTTRAGYLDTTVSSRASQTSVDSINTNVGTLINGRVVKSVQRGVVSSNAFNNSITIVNHNGVNIYKSIIILTGFLHYSGKSVGVWVESRNSDSFTLKIMFPQYTESGSVSWELIEFY